MTEAKPLIVTYNDGIEEAAVEEDVVRALTGTGFGERDAFAALSLDDGETWKNYNLSDSATRSSFVLQNGHPYPGDVFKLVHQVEGNRVVAAWISRYCESGSPLYSWTDEVKTELLTDYYPELDHPVNVDGVTDPEGFYHAGWWKDLALPEGHNHAPGEQAFEFWNHPRERVSWFDAIAFCRWLSARLGCEVRLPTEQEWEKAARGTDERIYPYSNDFDPAKGSTSETGIGQTSAVG